MSVPDRCRAGDSTDQGSVTAFVVGLLLTFIASAGLAIDSGRVVAAHIRTADVAENAARLAAQEITGIRSGDWYLDPARAGAAARLFLAGEGFTAQVVVGRRSVTVAASSTVRPTLLGLFGVGERTVRATRTAEPRLP